MEIIPALDLRGGRVVRLGVHGDLGSQTAYGLPAERAADYVRQGARRLHVVDLDAAAGQGDNRAAVRALLAAVPVSVQVAGGVRTEADAQAWLDAGAAAAVMGTTAVREPEVLAAAAANHPGRVLAALDLRDGRLAVTGWTAVAEVPLEGLLATWDGAALGGIILTSVDRDGSLAGPDLDALRRVRGLSRHPVVYSGGVASIDDLDRLREAGAAGVVLGRSLVEGRFSLEEAMGRCAL